MEKNLQESPTTPTHPPQDLIVVMNTKTIYLNDCNMYVLFLFQCDTNGLPR